jgi:integral membrane protein
MTSLFRLIALLEGVSYILLIFVAVPMKYLFGNTIFVALLGMPHGLLFVAYLFISFVIKFRLGWSFQTFFIVLAASIVPFATFYVDRKYLRE